MSTTREASQQRSVFTGFEAALLFIALGSLLDSPGISMGIWGIILGGSIGCISVVQGRSKRKRYKPHNLR